MDFERELSWNDEITKDSEFELLNEGDYNFEIISFERGRSKGSDKIPPSNMAILQIKVFDQNHQTIVTERLILHTKFEWKLSQFFCSIGQKKKGEPLKMNWNAVIGSKGRCKVVVDSYNGKEYNHIASFYESDNTQPSPQRQWTPGQF